jgi:integrase
MSKRGFGGIYKRGSVYWIRYWHRGKCFRESSGTDSEARAAKLLKERIKQMGRPGGFIGPAEERVTFENLAELVQTDYQINNRRSADKLRSRIAHMRDTFALVRVLDITTDRISAYIARRQESGASNATINRELSALKRAFNLAVRAKRLSSAPFIQMLEEHNARQDFISHSAFLSLRESLPEHLRDPISFLYLTGWRLSEMQTLEWRDVDLGAQTIRLRPENSKNQEGREIPFRPAPELEEIIIRAQARRRLDCRFVFHNRGHPTCDFRDSWANACSLANLGHILVHDLRRTAVRNLVRAGVPERVAMQITGHKTRTIFERYNIVSDNDKQNAVQKLAVYLEAHLSAPTVLPLTSGAQAG